ncbi:MAG: hypothetical protein HFF43_02835 [Lawsonibacter sp.]|jgi:hypothetical protein|nr:hypothetical protein [Lawsonibacter sp.]
MNKKVPRTPFSTPLSGSARETEMRLKHIFSGPKKRPPALFLALVSAACLLCGNLVSCQTPQAESTASTPPSELWAEYYSSGEAPQDVGHEIQLPEYPDTTFRWTAEGVSALGRDGETILFTGTPIISVFLCDLTGDSKRDFCADVGMDDPRIIVYDYASRTEYTLTGRDGSPYHLSLDGDQLHVEWSNWVKKQDGLLESYTGDLAISPQGVLEVANEQPPLTIRYQLASQLSTDINQNGIPEEIRLENEYGWDEVRFYENGQLINRELPGVCLYSYTGGQDYILRCYYEGDYPGVYYHSYNICDVSGESEEVIQYNNVRFDLNFNATFHSFDPAAIAAYVEELTGPAGTPSLGLFSHTWRLVVRDGELVAEEPELPLPWLEQFPEIFTRDPDKSLEEDLRNFQAAMAAAYPAPEPKKVDALPFDAPLEMIFSSGAGAWCTGLELNPDGSFTADYHDADGLIQYVCQYHGKLGGFAQLTEHSWALTLEELVLDTKYPVGTEWDEMTDWLEDGPVHFISSGPAGFEDKDGNTLQPGAQFILYSPEAQGHAPGTELYGAYEFWTWCLSRPDLAGGGSLGCWGLYNLASDIGFFTDP